MIDDLLAKKEVLGRIVNFGSGENYQIIWQLATQCVSFVIFSPLFYFLRVLSGFEFNHGIFPLDILIKLGSTVLFYLKKKKVYLF